MPQRRDYYEVLGVSPDAGAEEIRRAFHRGALRYHPDNQRGDSADAERKFKEISEAYHFLADASQRGRYDARLRHERTRRRGLSPQEMWEMSGSPWSAAGADAVDERESLKAYASLALALVATWCYPLVLPAVVCGVAALILGVLAKRDIARGRGTSYSREMSVAGRIIATMALVFAFVSLYVWVSLDIFPAPHP